MAKYYDCCDKFVWPNGKLEDCEVTGDDPWVAGEDFAS
jgi:hypothetical protein